jgi:hypothetical protein
MVSISQQSSPWSYSTVRRKKRDTALFFPCNKEIDATGVAVIYVRHVFPHYGVPKRIILDQDPCFTATFACTVCAQLNIKQNISIAYHPQMDGQSEWANTQVEQYLRIYGNTEQDDWVNLLPMVQYVHNSWINTSMGYTPFDLLIGHMPTMSRPFSFTILYDKRTGLLTDTYQDRLQYYEA